MKQEQWNGNTIRFVDVNGEWWAVAKDVADALGYLNSPKAIKDHVSNEDKQNERIVIAGQNREVIIINEFGTYDLVFSSKLPKAKEFKRWVFEVIKKLRQSAGLEGFETFRLLDKQHQKQVMHELNTGLNNQATEVDYIKANMIANKAVSNQYGHPKLIKKGEMTPEMLKARAPILNDVVSLMEVKEKFDLPISVSKTIYEKVGG
ncbi:phage repressor protein [Pediococcus pentosaceus]|uniref:BRO-N domain-containing protein n=1 Tax=Pediococcus pentosaceus TaxID=1255 RepID=UPI00223B802B|nr:BRO family protein [Pediococcus pentosaceus]MCS8563908.1 phage repressor protein [Pediococcus pentosaceus]MCS8568203.1 phage repressor protein [Pediococcus pentosaceus]MCS8580845.1 phage repressor protein [Pediococcus pentosaceus]